MWHAPCGKHAALSPVFLAVNLQVVSLALAQVKLEEARAEVRELLVQGHRNTYVLTAQDYINVAVRQVQHLADADPSPEFVSKLVGRIRTARILLTRHAHEEENVPNV